MNKEDFDKEIKEVEQEYNIHVKRWHKKEVPMRKAKEFDDFIDIFWSECGHTSCMDCEVFQTILHTLYRLKKKWCEK